MANKTYKKIIAKAAGFALMVGTLVGALAFGAPTSVVHAADSTPPATVWVAGGSYSWNKAAGITDPNATTTEKGTQYTPTAYVYYGSVYNAETKTFEPVLNRVLDADADNTGAEGAMFLLTENAIEATAWYPGHLKGMGIKSEDVYVENLYEFNAIGMTADFYSGTIFGNAFVNEGDGDFGYLRPITKTDTEASMNGLFNAHGACPDKTCTQCFIKGVTPYYFETDKHSPNYNGSDWFTYSYNELGLIVSSWQQHSEDSQALTGDKYFLLSVKEVNDYIGTYHEAPTLAATNMQNVPVTWVTRTGLGDTYEIGNIGNFVAGIDRDGNIIPVSVDDATAYTRLGFNVDTTKIVYSNKVDSNRNAYQLAFTHPGYDADYAFAADILGTKEGVVTLEYSNAYDQRLRDGWKAYITVVIERGGTILHYANVSEAVAGASAKQRVEFSLPEGYTYQPTDEIKVFWEYKPADNKGVSYVSNIVEIACLHPYTGVPTCSTSPVCTVSGCGATLTPLRDPDNHTALTDWEQGEKNGKHAHWRYCDGCDPSKNNPIDFAYCDVQFGTTQKCIGTCSCGRVVEDPSRCNFDENGICTYDHTHYEPPSYVVQTNTVKVVIENEGQWNYYASLVNNAQSEKNADGYYVYYPSRKNLIVVAADLDFTGLPFIPLGCYESEDKITYLTGEFSPMSDVTISGISYSDLSDNVGLFGYARDLIIHRLSITESRFSGGQNVGLIGYGKNVVLQNVDVAACSFSGTANVGAVIGRAEGASISLTVVRHKIVTTAGETTQVTPVVVTATGEPTTAGAFIGQITGTSGVTIGGGCLAMGVKDTATNGNDLPFVTTLTPESGAVVTVSTDAYCLYATDCAPGAVWDGTASAETFAGGKVAYMLQRHMSGWSQILDKREFGDTEDKYLTPDPLPVYIPKNESGRREGTVYKVYHVTYCNGTSSGKYTNNATRDYMVHLPSSVSEWKWDDWWGCEAYVHCDLCGEDVWMEAHVELDYTYVPVRSDYYAYLLDPDGNKYVDATKGEPFSSLNTIIGIRIESMIGMTNVVMDYDGHGLYPEDLMNNHRLNDGTIPADKEYEVWFLNAETGERVTEKGWKFDTEVWQDVWTDIPAPAVDAGTYHLLVIGKNDYTGQEYTFENVLVINPVVVEIEPADVYKYYDGTATFTPSYRITDPELAAQFGGNWEGEYFLVEFTDAKNSAEGRYPLRVTVESRLSDDNIRFVLTRDTVQAAILPRLFVDLENKNFPTTFTYGDTIPTPTADHFTFTEGSTLTFEWYKANIKRWQFEDPVTKEQIDQFEVLSRTRMDGSPTDAGDYILRVRASGVGKLAGRFIEVIVTVKRAETLGITFDTEGVQTYSDGYQTFYVMEMGDTIPYEITGLKDGDTMESAGIYVEISYSQAEATSYPPGDSDQFPYQPFQYNYAVRYYVRCRDAFGNQGNYADARDVLYVMVVVGNTAKPIPATYLTTDEKKNADVSLTWPAVAGATQYTLVVTNPDSTVSTPIIRTVNPDDESDWHSDIRLGNIFANYTLTQSGTYSVTVTPSDSETTAAYTFEFDVTITNEHGELVDQIGNDPGRYTVTVIQNGKSASADIYVQREIVMMVKETEINLSESAPAFDVKNVVMEAGKVIMLGHKLVDVQMSINAQNASIGVGSLRVVDSTGKDVTYMYRLKTYSSELIESRPTLNKAHIFDNACDSDCNETNCTYTRVTAHSGGRATCTDQAICEHCSTPYGELNAANHVSTATHVAPNGTDRETHLLLHSCCGMTKEILEHVEGTPATCNSYAVCADCGWEYGDLNPDNHADSTFTYAYVDDHGHTATHTCCGTSETVEHTGGTATCLEEAVCEHCLTAYGSLDRDNHVGKITATIDPEDPTMHVEAYDCCHTSETVRHRGGEATCLSPAVCEVCLSEYGTKDPHHHASDETVYSVRAENASMHDVTHACCGTFVRKEYHSGGTATCRTAAVCQHCDEEYGVEADASNHETDEVIYKLDTTQEGLHIAVHACCGEEIARQSHSGGTATCQSGPICEHCHTEYGAPHEHEFDNACDSVCNLCEKQARALVFHVDSDEDHVCDECQTALNEGEAVSHSAVSPAMQSLSGGKRLAEFPKTLVATTPVVMTLPAPESGREREGAIV